LLPPGSRQLTPQTFAKTTRVHRPGRFVPGSRSTR
jgi:hypothetical protein